MVTKYESVRPKIEFKSLGWICGILAGLFLLHVPVMGVTVMAFSTFMFFSTLKSEKTVAYRMFNKGMAHYDKGHYSYSYVMFKKAYELHSEDPELIRMLILSNINLKKDLVEARILIEELASKWSESFTAEDIEELRYLLDLKLVS